MALDVDGRRLGRETADRGEERERARVCECATFLWISVANLSHRIKNEWLQIVGPFGLERAFIHLFTI
jgi:hypothetical protein